MTARAAFAAGLSLLEIDRQMPGTKRNGISDMFRIVGGVGIVTCSAGSPLIGLVDMHVMEILVPVAKTGQRGGILFFSDGLLMAHETEFVVACLVGCIEKLREIFPQHSEVVGTVGIVTGRTIILPYRSVVVLVLLQNCLHIGEFHLAVLAVFPVVTAQAEFGRLHDQLIGIISDMGIVTGKAFLVRIESVMFYFGLCDMFFLVVMAGETEISFPVGR